MIKSGEAQNYYIPCQNKRRRLSGPLEKITPDQSGAIGLFKNLPISQMRQVIGFLSIHDLELSLVNSVMRKAHINPDFLTQDLKGALLNLSRLIRPKLNEYKKQSVKSGTGVLEKIKSMVSKGVFDESPEIMHALKCVFRAELFENKEIKINVVKMSAAELKKLLKRLFDFEIKNLQVKIFYGFGGVNIDPLLHINSLLESLKTSGVALKLDLRFTGCNTNCFKPLKQLNITHLTLSYCSIDLDIHEEGLNELIELTTLLHLDLSGQDNLNGDDLDVIAKKLVNLTHLSLRYCQSLSVDDLKCLKQLKNLVFLDVGGCGKITQESLSALDWSIEIVSKVTRLPQYQIPSQIQWL